MLNNLAKTYLVAFEYSSTPEKAAWSKKTRCACQMARKTSSICQPKAPKAIRLQGTYAWLAGKPGAAMKWWEKSLAEAERMGWRYDMGIVHAEMGIRLRERGHVEKGEAIFSEISARSIWPGSGKQQWL